jgi:hypothetical protein
MPKELRSSLGRWTSELIFRSLTSNARVSVLLRGLLCGSGSWLPPHEIVRNAEDYDFVGDLKTKSTIETHVLGSIGLEVASFAGSIELFAVFLHESMTDMLTLHLW